MTEFLDACYDAIKKQETSISETIASVDEKDADILKDKRLIVLTGCGDSYAVAEYGKWAFLRVGLNAISLSPTEMSKIQLDKDVVVIGVTASGRSLATIDGLNIAKAEEATIIAITDNENGSASALADHVWVTRSGVESHNISPASITTTAMVYLLKLAARHQAMPQSRMYNDLQKLKGNGKQLLDWAEKVGKESSRVGIPGKPLYMISDGPNHVAAQIGMMKFNEYGVIQSNAALWEDFQHHYVLTINPGDSAFLVTDSPLEEKNKKYFQALTGTLKMNAHHLYTPESLKLESPLGQTVANSIALQMAAYYNVMEYDPGKEFWRRPNVDAFKIY
ncbi:MAG: MurR/RpiR family transcriptional regulator [Candidatus Thorarchaeota archaeon]|jgi:glucosamine 6-phosphate synthetase-like amidotransferase/phosphosugar isomerase protein